MTDVAWEKRAEDQSLQTGTVSWTTVVTIFAAILVIHFCSHAFQFLFADQVVEGLSRRPVARSNPVYLANFGLQLVLFLTLLIVHIVGNGIRTPLLIAFGYCGFVLASIFWSAHPKTTLVPAILFSYLVVAAYVCAAMLQPKQFLKLLYYLFLFFLISSFLLLLSGSSHAVSERYGGGWLTDFQFSGVLSSKNFAGIIFASSILLALCGHHFGASIWSRLLMLGLGLVAVVLSNSATAMVIVVVLIVPALLLQPRLLGWQKLLFTMLLALTCILPVIPFLSSGDFLEFLGRDATFTGRTGLWSVAFEEFRNHPLLGHGYYAFFDADPYSPVWRMWERYRYWSADNFHNSVVDIMISLGSVGVLVMLGTILAAATIVANNSIEAGVRITLGLLLAAFVIGSMMEFAIFHHNYIATFLLFYVFFAGRWHYPDHA